MLEYCRDLYRRVESVICGGFDAKTTQPYHKQLNPCTDFIQTPFTTTYTSHHAHPMPTSPFLLHQLRRLLSSPLPYLPEAFTFHKFRTLAFLVPKIFCFGHLVTAYVGYEALTHGPSMLPTLAGQGDRVFISAHYRHGRDIAVGDLVSFKHPCVPGTEAVKRVAGMPGDFVMRDTLPEGRKPSGRETMLQVCLNLLLLGSGSG